MTYIESSEIKVFPSNRRNDTIDRNARLFTEQNITGIVKGVTNKNFVISGLDIQNNELQPGECSIGGYYFNIDATQKLSSPNEGKIYLYLGIQTHSFEINTGYYLAQQYNSTETYYIRQGDGTSENPYVYEPLQPAIDNFTPDIYYTQGRIQLKQLVNFEYVNGTANTLDDSNGFMGLSLFTSDQTPEQMVQANFNYLLLGQYENNIWLTNPNNKIKYTEEDATLDDGEIP